MLAIGFVGIFCIIGGSVACVADLSLLFDTGSLGCIFCCGLAGGFAGLKGGAGGELAFGDEPTTRLPRAPPTAVRSASCFVYRLIVAHTLLLISFHGAICSCALAISKSLIVVRPLHVFVKFKANDNQNYSTSSVIKDSTSPEFIHLIIAFETAFCRPANECR
jgi:hypothetical protein